MTQQRSIAVLTLAMLTVAGCAAGPNPMAHTAGVHGVAGFWLGLWQGLICPIAFVISFFNQGVSMYEVHNSGWSYNLAFILGAGAWGVLGGNRGRR